jgi:hypothetical protein
MSDPSATVELWIGWAFIGWMLVVMFVAPAMWAWLIWSERRYSSQVDEAKERHPARGTRTDRGPEDDRRWPEWASTLGRGD